MVKFKFLILSIIVILIFSDSTEIQAQFSFANEICRTSFMSPTIKNGSSSFTSSTLAQKDSNEKRLTIVDKIIFIPVGIVFGTFHGCLASIVIPGDDFGNGIKGGMIGFCIGPFLSYEMFAAKRGVKNPLHKFFIKAGRNVTLTNYDDSKIKMRYAVGIGRQYHLLDRIGLRGEVSYTL